MKAVEALALDGVVDEELLERNEYLAAENEILRSKVDGRIRFAAAEKHLPTTRWSPAPVPRPPEKVGPDML